MNIHQLSVSYLHEQDRILVRINSAEAQEIRLWLTRRLCIEWAPVLRDTLDAPTAKAKLAKDGQVTPVWAKEFQRLQNLQNLKSADFSTPFKADAQSWPLGSEPLLVTTVHVATSSDGGMELRFDESLASSQQQDSRQERSFLAVLAPKLVHGFVHLLELALEASQWEQHGVRPGGMHASAVDTDEHLPREQRHYLH
jgi:hypothetical protein